MVAEKPSIAGSIASILGAGRESLAKSGKLPVHEFPGVFMGKHVTYRVTSVAGHVFSTDFPNEYQSWDTVDPETLFEAPTVKSETSKGVISHLKDCARGASYVVLWLDCDREGENICFEVLDVISAKLERVSGQQIFRARFSAIAKSDIENAMRSLTSPNENESLAVDARQELDLKVGVAFSRFQTRFFQGRYGNLDSSTISYGPCQTPTLGFCVDRHDEILTFTPENFWSVDVEVEQGGQRVVLEWERGRLFDYESAVLFDSLVRESGPVIVTSVRESETTRPRPTAMNTVEMLKAASRVLGMGPAHAMHAAERLYLSGYVSYPRTESTHYPDSFDLHGAVAAQRGHPHWGSFASSLLRDGLQRPKKGVDNGDHPPITPVRMALPGELTGDMDSLYDLITRHFLATGEFVTSTVVL